ncbi:hypothetical protein KAT80_01020 [Candidatus Pacearchaeota archaeon]|nr:hypothetical protein [Candidatus Pacearchaeota archaeon]
MIREYQLKGNEPELKQISLSFLNLSSGTFVSAYAGGQGKCSIDSPFLDSTAIYFEKGNRMVINGSETDLMKKLIQEELKGRGLNIKWE